MKPADTQPVPLPKIEPSDRLGTVVPVPPALEGADLTNVIVLAHRRNTGELKAPQVSIGEDARPAPIWTWATRTPWTALIAGALLLHLALVLMFMRDPAPIPSLAIDSISVEVVLGGQTEAGIAQAPSSEQSKPSPASESAPEQEQVTEEPKTEVTEEKPAEITEKAEITEETKPDLKPSIEPSEPQREQPKSEESQTAAAEPESAAAEPEPAPSPEPEPTPVVAEKEPALQEPVLQQAQPDEPKPVERPIEQPVAHQPPQPKPEPRVTARPQTRPSPPRIAAAPSGFGIGRSVNIDSYLNQVARHLARYQQGVPAAVRERGAGRWVAQVRFTFDEGGRVTSVRLARSSGIRSLDTEALAIVRRASPLPAPPAGGPTNLTVPVVFNVTDAR